MSACVDARLSLGGPQGQRGDGADAGAGDPAAMNNARRQREAGEGVGLTAHPRPDGTGPQ